MKWKKKSFMWQRSVLIKSFANKHFHSGDYRKSPLKVGWKWKREQSPGAWQKSSSVNSEVWFFPRDSFLTFYFFKLNKHLPILQWDFSLEQLAYWYFFFSFFKGCPDPPVLTERPLIGLVLKSSDLGHDSLVQSACSTCWFDCHFQFSHDPLVLEWGISGRK